MSYHVQVAEDLNYSQEYIQRIKKCKTKKEKDKLLEYARIDSIYREIKNKPYNGKRGKNSE